MLSCEYYACACVTYCYDSIPFMLVKQIIYLNYNLIKENNNSGRIKRWFLHRAYSYKWDYNFSGYLSITTVIVNCFHKSNRIVFSGTLMNTSVNPPFCMITNEVDVIKTSAICPSWISSSFNVGCKTLYIGTSDNFWSAFCVFHAHFWKKTHSFKICALKNAMIFDI